MIWENGIETYIISYMKRVASPGSMHDTGYWDDPEGWCGEGGGRRVQDGTVLEAIMEKEMATHSSVLSWRIPGMGEPGGLPSMGLHRVGHD